MAIRIEKDVIEQFEKADTTFRWFGKTWEEGEGDKAKRVIKEVCVAVFKPTGEPYCYGYGDNKREAFDDLLVQLKTCTKRLSAAAAVAVLSERDAEIARLKERVEALQSGTQRVGTNPIQIVGS